MCKFLTGPARLEQTSTKRVWRLLDNELYKDEDGTVYIVPRNMLTDNYTIPMFVAIIAGSPVDYDTRCSHLHDECCYFHQSVKVTLSEDELKDKGILRYSEKNKMWICEDIPAEFLYTEKISKYRANNLLYKCMKTSNVPLYNRILIRIGVCFNIGWYLDILFNRVITPILDDIYKESFWQQVLKNKG
jgi:hypothetical protein